MPVLQGLVLFDSWGGMALNEQPKKAAEPNLLDNLWRFNYRRGSAPMTGVVRARTAALAFKVAAKFCELNGFRTPAGIDPMVLADESILNSQPAVAVEDFNEAVNR